MTIATVETYIVEQELDKPFYFSQWRYDRRSVCLVKVTTDDGTHGWGEGYGPSGVVAAGVELLAPLVVGSDPLREGATWQAMHLRALDYARRGVLMASISAIDVALWDLKGKLLQQPVSVLLSGRRRDAVLVYATGMYFTDGPNLTARLAQEASQYVAEGFTAVKMKVGLGLREDAANVAAVREAIGGDTLLMVDANHAFSRAEAAELARAIAPHRIHWFEEPLSPEDYDGYRELRERTTVPIAAGECEYLCAGFKQLLECRCVDFAQPDVCAAGGLTEAVRIAALARAFGANVAPHCWGTGIAFAAALHFVSTLDVAPGRLNAPEPLLEMDRTENPLRDELTVPLLEPRDGKVTVPDSPGLGVDVDADRLLSYAKSR